jgi:hypothetical protein
MGRLGGCKVKVHSASVLLFSIIFATIGGGANAICAQNMSVDAGTGLWLMAWDRGHFCLLKV